MDAASFGQLLQYGGAVTVLCFVVLGFVRGWIVSKPQHDQIVTQLEQRAKALAEDRDDWKDIAVRSQEAAGKIASVAVTDRTRRAP